MWQCLEYCDLENDVKGTKMYHLFTVSQPNVSMQSSTKIIHCFSRQSAHKLLSVKRPFFEYYDLKNEVMVPKSSQLLSLSQWPILASLMKIILLMPVPILMGSGLKTMSPSSLVWGHNSNPRTLREQLGTKPPMLLALVYIASPPCKHTVTQNYIKAYRSLLLLECI